MTAPKILIVEDEGILAKGLESTLKRTGFGVAGTASSGREAVAQAAETQPDLVLMDIRLGGEMDGIRAAEEIRAAADIPVIYLTAYADKETLQRAKLTAPGGYLVKPFDEKLLLITIEMALSKHQADAAVREALSKADHQKRFFEALFQSIPVGVAVLRPNGQVRAVNPCFERMFGKSSDEVVGSDIGDVMSCVSVSEGHLCASRECAHECQVWKVLRQAREGGAVHRAKAVFRGVSAGTGRDLHLRLTATAVEHDGEAMSLLAIEDTTELTELRRMLKSSCGIAGMVGTSKRMREVYTTIREVADSTVPVLLQGESGTGKELVALAIHNESPRAKGRFVAVNCGALPDGLLETEMFGHAKGAFTGAVRDKKGRFELANGGTLFLDEIGELSVPMQVKLLRVLQSGAFERVGSEETIRVDVRIVAATNRDLQREVAAGRFRGDLYYRLCVVPIQMPALRDRREDIPLLAEHLLARIAKERETTRTSLSPEARDLLLECPWPGNVRELENALQFAILKSRGEEIRPGHLPPSLQPGSSTTGSKVQRQKKLRGPEVEEAIRNASGNKLKAAKLLGVGRATLYRFLENEPPPDAGP